MEEIIKQLIGEEKLLGVIPLDSKRLKIQQDNISMKPTALAYVLMFFAAVVMSLFSFGFFSFILFDLGASVYSVLLFYVLILLVLFYFAEKIYVNSIKTYPFAALMLTGSKLHYFFVENNQLKTHNTFHVEIENLGKSFYGEVNAKSGKVGKRFMIKNKGNVLASGNLDIKNNAFSPFLLKNELLLPIEELHKIVNS